MGLCAQPADSAGRGRRAGAVGAQSPRPTARVKRLHSVARAQGGHSAAGAAGLPPTAPLAVQHDDGALGRSLQVGNHALKVQTDGLGVKVAAASEGMGSSGREPVKTASKPRLATDESTLGAGSSKRRWRRRSRRGMGSIQTLCRCEGNRFQGPARCGMEDGEEAAMPGRHRLTSTTAGSMTPQCTVSRIHPPCEHPPARRPHLYSRHSTPESAKMFLWLPAPEGGRHARRRGMASVAPSSRP